VQRDARIGEAEARRDAGIKEAIAEEQRMQARYSNDIEIAQSKRDFELKKAAYDMEVQTKKAEADLAYSLQVRYQAIFRYTPLPTQCIGKILGLLLSL